MMRERGPLLQPDIEITKPTVQRAQAVAALFVQPVATWLGRARFRRHSVKSIGAEVLGSGERANRDRGGAATAWNTRSDHAISARTLRARSRLRPGLPSPRTKAPKWPFIPEG